MPVGGQRLDAVGGCGGVAGRQAHELGGLDGEVARGGLAGARAVVAVRGVRRERRQHGGGGQFVEDRAECCRCGAPLARGWRAAAVMRPDLDVLARLLGAHLHGARGAVHRSHVLEGGVGAVHGARCC